MLISISNYWELEPGRNWKRLGPAVSNGGAALFEDDTTGHVFHAQARDYCDVHEWDPNTASYVGHYEIGLAPKAKYYFYAGMAPCLVGRDVFVLNVSSFSAFAFNLDSKAARAIELDAFPAFQNRHTCVTYGPNVLLLVDSGELWRIDPKRANCRPFAAQGIFGAHPLNGMYGRARVWNDLLIVVPVHIRKRVGHEASIGR